MTEFSAASVAQFHMIVDVTLFCVLAVCVAFAGYRGHHHALETVELKKAGCAAVQAVDGDRWFSPGELVSIERLCGRDAVAVVLAAAAPVDGAAVGGGASVSRD